MRLYCSRCANSQDIRADYNLAELALNLYRGVSTPIDCADCNIKALYKDEKGLIYLGYLIDGATELKAVNVEDL